MRNLSKTIGAGIIHLVLTFAPPLGGMMLGDYVGKNDYINTKKYTHFEFAMPNNKASMINFYYVPEIVYQKQGEFIGLLFGIALSGFLNYKCFRYRKNNNKKN